MAPERHGSHSLYMTWVKKEARLRKTVVEKALREAFSPFIERRSVEVIVFSGIGALELAQAIFRFPLILKPIIAACNIAARAIERDLKMKNVNTFNPKVSEKEASVLAGYIKPFLPEYLELPALSCLDQVSFIDKEIRKAKGRWERRILDALNRYGKAGFKKRKFASNGEDFEIDAASPPEGPILIAIDIKRIEARRDIHKRCDEIVNKATKFKTIAKRARFAAVLYYPFIDEHINIQNRLRSRAIDAVSFASESDDSIDGAIRMLLAQLGVRR